MGLSFARFGKGQDLVLLHGWGFHSAVWSDFADALAQNFCVTAIDLPGHGRSGLSGVRDGLQGWADACADVAPKRATWVGWSLGALVALDVVARKPGRVSALVLVSGTPRFVRTSDWPDAMPPATLENFARALEADRDATLGRFVALHVHGLDAPRSQLRRLNGLLSLGPRASIEGLRAGLRILADNDLRPALGGVGCPVLWLLGRKDAIVPASVAGWLARIRPGMRFEILDGEGHAPFLSQPDACARMITELAGCRLEKRGFM